MVTSGLSFLSNLQLQTNFSGWFIPVCILVGLGYAFLLYQKKAPWSKAINRFLFSVRAVLIAFICFFLLEPVLNQLRFFEEKPLIVFAIDDSASLPAAYDSLDFLSIKNRLRALADEMVSSDWEVKIKSQEQYLASPNAINFTAQRTNLHELLTGIAKDFEKQNHVATVLVSDGIHNLGTSPDFLNLPYPVISIPIGDTIPARDLSIKNVQYNKIVYEGKQFPIKVDVLNNGYIGEQVQVDIVKNKEVVTSKSMTVLGDQQINSFEFLIEANEIGIDNYEVVLKSKAGESTQANNQSSVFVEVVDSEQKILFVAAAPHPDIKALREVIETKQGVEVSIYIPQFEQPLPEGPFDLLILHQLPKEEPLNSDLTWLIKNTNTFFITGATNLSEMNEANPVLNYNSNGLSDAVSPNLNPGFDLFSIEAALANRSQNYPPILAPYGNFSFKNQAAILLYQRVGRVSTERPLLTVFNGNDRKSAVFSGANLWKWKLQESGQFGTSAYFDTVFGKLIQFLSTKEDKRKLRVNPTQEMFLTTEKVEFNTEVYNEIFEKVYDYPIDLQLTQNGESTEEYNYVNSQSNPFYINNLTPGIYTYEAATDISGNRETVSGSFRVDELALEEIDMTANHQLLRNISRRSGGQLADLEDPSAVISAINHLNPRTVTRSSEAVKPIIENPIWLFLMIALLSLEWFTRKYNGSY